jgi:hypothetical protein
MPLFRCASCGSVENTALSNYWMLGHDGEWFAIAAPPLCSACDPKIGEWHGAFPRRSADSMLLGADGFLYESERRRAIHHTRILGLVSELLAPAPHRRPAPPVELDA